MEQEILQKLEEQQLKIDKMFESVEKLRKYFLWTLIVTVATVVAPLIILVFVAPLIMSSLANFYGLGL